MEDFSWNFSATSSEIEFISDELELTIFEKVVIIFMWFLIETLGNAMLFGWVQFDRLGGDPLKRRIVDQVRHIFFFFLRKCVDVAK